MGNNYFVVTIFGLFYFREKLKSEIWRTGFVVVSVLITAIGIFYKGLFLRNNYKLNKLKLDIDRKMFSHKIIAEWYSADTSKKQSK